LTDNPSSEAQATGPVAFIGLGMMGLPMASRLVSAVFDVHGSDLSAAARDAFAATGGKACASVREAASGAAILITMLPDGKIVREALLGEGGAAEFLATGALIVDMSSSAPMQTRRLAEDLAAKGISLIDAPVSGGVRRAQDGSLAIMAGGDAADIDRARPLLEAMGKSVFSTGPIGSGHATKALNNYVSAAGLAAACEAVIVAEKFGIDPNVLVDVFNVSTGRNNSTEMKMKPFILSGTFASAFSLALMAKDLATAADLAGQLGVGAEGVRDAATLWAEASQALGNTADHTEIFRFLAARNKR
jgi:3-hydroxyisobutyrate dehydrogenase